MKFIRLGPGLLSDNALEETLILIGRRVPGSRPQEGLTGDNPRLYQEDQRLTIEAPELKVEEGCKADPEKIRDHQQARQRAVGPKGQKSSANGQPQRHQVDQTPAEVVEAEEEPRPRGDYGRMIGAPRSRVNPPRPESETGS